MGILFALDLGMVGKRYLDNGSFETERQYEENFAPRPADQQILQDPELYYRVYDSSISTFQCPRHRISTKRWVDTIAQDCSASRI
ncbi:MAG: hypothetical protein R2769_05345 [Saprospiraceae bacterium]